MDPTYKQLKYLHAISQVKSLRRAAERLDVSQPTLTAQINTLEERVGVTLLQRSRQGTELTPAGRAFMPHIEVMIKEMTSIKRLAADAEGNLIGTYRLGVPPTLGPYFLPEVIPTIHKTFTELKMFVREKEPRDLEVGLTNGDYDLIITTLPMEIPNLSIEPLFNEPLVLVCALDHPFANMDEVSPELLKGENLLAIEEKHRLFDLMQTIAAQFGARLLRDYEGTSLDTLRHMIGTGLGLAFLPSLYVKSEIAPRRDVTSVKFAYTDFMRGVVLAWRPGSPRTELYRKMASIMRGIAQKNLSEYVTLNMQITDIEGGKL
ncbi:hydrogen peroxide-inducible genes activator [Kordiimonas aquimaris]|uniref:hydrogen peroxide-inducible genes activator n=1 Tax=Kordiimonas aquimaris TaxID=707591 RepID=UPI0021D16D41|nr:hydrogen peroxide-inducible genes activator [Kordiimonas aquimaris]